jgi:hypothetical protein
VAGFVAGILATPLIFGLMYLLLEARNEMLRETAVVQMPPQSRASIDKSGSLNVTMPEQVHRATDVEREGTSLFEPEMPGDRLKSAGMGSGGMTPGSSDFSDLEPMPAPALEPASGGPPIVFSDDRPALSKDHFTSLSAEQRVAVNMILKESHERYLKDEALHSIVSVDANGVQTTEISAFPDQLRAIENEMWTKLDDAVPVSTQKEFRSQLNLYTTEGQSDGGGSEGMGSMGMGGAMPGGEMGMSARMMTGPGTGPGLLGWEPRHYPLKLNISRSGRWFEWSIQSKHHSVTGSKAPTLPSALQRFYREPGPWMAVANARATYAAKDWMKFADHFTASAMTREILNSMAFGDAIDVHLNEEGAAEDHQKRVMQEVARSPALSEMLGKAIVADGQGANGTELRLEDLIQQLQGASPDDVDAIIERATKGVPQETLRQVFAMWALGIAVIGEEVFEFDLVNGELSSYTKADDTASATLTIPRRKLPVTFLGKSPIELDDTFWADGPIPIRFKRENGQWKIDAIGSNERLLERLKHTKIWKQHAEIEAVLENARTAYAAKEWQKLADCFTRAGKYRWTLRALSMVPTNASPLPEEEAKLRMERYRAEIERLSVQQAAAGRIIDQPLPEDGDGKEWRILLDQFLSCPANESDAVLIKLTESLPETVFDSSFAGWAILSAFLYPDVNCFDFDGWQITDLKLTEGIATANLVSKEGTPPMPVRFAKHDGQWKIDAIGTSEELQQQVRIALERQNGDSPRAAVEAFREAMADGRFQTALNCMTEDARNEWLGEMLIGYVSDPNADNFENTARFSVDEVHVIRQKGSVSLTLDDLLNRLKDQVIVFSDRTLSRADRSKYTIEIGKAIGEKMPKNLIGSFLTARFQKKPEIYGEQGLGEFQEIPVWREGADVTIYRLRATSPYQQPLELDIIQVDGLWKLNTIIDPAMKPWPLPTEEPTPPAEATPVDGIK